MHFPYKRKRRRVLRDKIREDVKFKVHEVREEGMGPG